MRRLSVESDFLRHIKAIASWLIDTAPQVETHSETRLYFKREIAWLLVNLTYTENALMMPLFVDGDCEHDPTSSVVFKFLLSLLEGGDVCDKHQALWALGNATGES